MDPRRFARLCLCLCFALSAVRPAAHAQSTTSPPPFSQDYLGQAVWRPGDGSVRRGTFSLYLADTASSVATVRFSAQFDFVADPGSGTPAQSFLFSGKLDPSGRALLKYAGESVPGYDQTYPSLQSLGNKVAILFTPGGLVIGGGLGEAGDEFSFRGFAITGRPADFQPLPSPGK